ncbi:hypothetical protein X757_23430 [Mesorhizobium sp. LSHC414A00]|nr:hypothetical protein X757_23430 [Mesorhizobium sp. LSHC414A00]
MPAGCGGGEFVLQTVEVFLGEALSALPERGSRI